MAQHASAKKRIRRNARRSDINGSRITRIRSTVRKVEEAKLLETMQLRRKRLRKRFLK
jgi:ribosomal protein S20